MSIKTILSYLGITLFVVGIIIGIGLIFQSDSLVLGSGVIIYSLFMYIFCEWLRQMIDNSEEQTGLLKQIRDKLNEKK